MRKYDLVIIKDGKEILCDESPNWTSIELSEMQWDGHRFDLSELWKKTKGKNK